MSPQLIIEIITLVATYGPEGVALIGQYGPALLKLLEVAGPEVTALVGKVKALPADQSAALAALFVPAAKPAA